MGDPALDDQSPIFFCLYTKVRALRKHSLALRALSIAIYLNASQSLPPRTFEAIFSFITSSVPS